MLRSCTLLLLASAAFAATKPEEITPKPKAAFVQPVEADRSELHKAIQAYMSLPAEQVTAHPAAKDFPGSVESKERVTRTVAYDANLVTRWDTSAGNAPNLATGPETWQETGLYAAPGEVLIVTAPALPEGRIVRIIVGCHRDSLLNDLYYTLEVIDAIPELLLTADLSHFVLEREFQLPLSVRDRGYLQRIQDRTDCFQGRIASREQIQVQIDFPQHAPWVALFKELWKDGLRSWRSRNGPDATCVFLCELGPPPYAITDGRRQELSDRWEEALQIRQWIRDIWLELEQEA